MLNRAPLSQAPEVTVQTPDILGLYNHLTAKREAEQEAERQKKLAEDKAKENREAAEKAARAAQTKAEAAGSAKPASSPKPSDVFKARDGQTFQQQTAWTQQAFRSRYGEQAAQKWKEEHDAELTRNVSIYGVAEPTAGQKSLDGKTVSPDRTIGRVSAPSPTVQPNTSATPPVPTTRSGQSVAFLPKPAAPYRPPTQMAPGQPTLVNGSPSAMGAAPQPGGSTVTPTPQDDPDKDVVVYRNTTTGKTQRIHTTQVPYENLDGWELLGPASIHAPTIKPQTLPGNTTQQPQTQTMPGTTAQEANTQRLSLSEDGTPPTYQLARMTTRTGEDPQVAGSNILQGIGKLIRGEPGGEAYEPYLNDMARLAWAKQEQSQGRQADPRQAPSQYIESWKDAFFGSDHTVPGVKELDQQLIDNAVVRTTQGGAAFDWRRAFGEHGELGLISRQVTSRDCGPNSFANILRSRGYNADPAQTFEYAQSRGYHDGEQFRGPFEFARMLREEAGLNAQAQRVDWAKIDEELAAGRPVVLSSGTHYWTIASKKDTPDGPVYYTGATGAVVQNPEWARPDQIKFAYGGDPGVPDVMITAQGAVRPDAPAVQTLGLKPPGAQGPTRENLSAMTRQMQNGQYSNTNAANTDQFSTVKMRSNTMMGTYYDRYGQISGDYDVAKYAYGAQNENPWTPDLEAQQNRHSGMRKFYEMPSSLREAIFDESMEEALKAEGIPPQEWGYWKSNMAKVVMGTPEFPGENPNLNPFMMAGESRGTPMYASDSSDRSPHSNELNSSAQGYYQFIIHSPDGSDAYGHRRFIPEGANFYDPVTQHRMFIRAIRSPDSKHHGDPASVVREKALTKVWGP